MWVNKFSFCLLIVFFNIHFCGAQFRRGNNNGQCSIKGLEAVDWDVLPLRIDDNSQGIIKSFEDENTVKSISATYDPICEGCMDISYVESNHSININLLNKFLHFEETLPSVFQLNPRIKLTCQGESELDVRIDLEDVNDHDPEFVQIKDTVTLPMPIPSNVNVGELNDDFRITAKDIDFKNKGIDFTIEPDEYFEVSTVVDDDKVLPNKQIYKAIIKTKQQMNINKDYKIKITAKDKPYRSEDRPRIVSRDIIIKVDEKNSVLPTPVFQKPLYKASYNVETGSFIMNEGVQLKETNKKQHSYLEAENSLFKDSFTITDDLDIKLNQKLDEEQIKDLNYIILFVITNFMSENLKDMTEGKTVVLIDLKKPAPTTTTSTTEKTTTITTTACPPCETTTSITCPTTTTPEVTTSCPPCPTTPETTTSHSTTEPSTCPTCPTNPECTTTSQLTTDSSSCPTCPPCSTVSEETTTSHFTTETHCPTCQPCSTESTPSTCPTTCEPCETTCTTHDPSPTTCEPCVNPTCEPCTTFAPCPTTCEPCECNSTPSSCPTTVPCDCPTTTVKPGTSLKYKQEKYKFDQTDDYYGSIQNINAISSEPNEEILYDFDIDEPTIKSSISYGPKDSDLKITAKIPTGEYHLTLHATGQSTNNKAKTDVILRISTKQICDDDDGSYKFSQKLVIKHAMENHPKDSLTTLSETDKYKLKILEIYPKEFENVFSINEKDQSLNMGIVDREDKKFEQFLLPQIQIKLKAIPKQEDLISKREAIPKEYGWVLTENIDNKNDEMMLNIIIEDENDNKPIFEDIKNPLILGYPSSDFANIAPPYLTKVTATDKDIGENGRVSYYISGNDRFLIDSNEGIIALTKDAFTNDDSEEIIVFAKDHGKPPLESDRLKIKVKLLEKEHISVITVDDLSYGDIDKFFEDLNKKSKGTIFEYISASPVLSIENKPKLMKNDQLPRDGKTQMRVVIYAMKNEIPLKTEDIKDIIKDNVKNDVDVENIQDSPLKCESNETNCDETGWIVAVSILSVAFVGAIVAIIIIYFKYIRDMPDLILETKPSSETTSFEKNKDETVTKKSSLANRRATGFPTNFDPKLLEEDDEDEEEDKQEEKEQNEIIITDNINTTDSTKIGVDNLGLEPDDSDVESGGKEDKNEGKKVVFNEEVEEIHITIL